MKPDSNAIGDIEYVPPPAITAETVPIDSPGSGGILSEKEMYIPNENDLTAFFAVGMVVNIVMLIAFLVWAVNQWRKK